MKKLMVIAALLIPTLSHADDPAPSSAQRISMIEKVMGVDESAAEQIDAAMAEFDAKAESLMSQLHPLHTQIDSVGQGQTSLTAEQVDSLISQTWALEDQLRQNGQAMYAAVTADMTAAQKARFTRLLHPGPPPGGMPPRGGPQGGQQGGPPAGSTSSTSNEG